MRAEECSEKGKIPGPDGPSVVDNLELIDTVAFEQMSATCRVACVWLPAVEQVDTWTEGSGVSLAVTPPFTARTKGVRTPR